MRSKFAGWLLYRLFIWASKNATFNDFTRIYNEAYAVHAEEEWMRLRKMNSQSTKSPQDGLVGLAEATQKELPSNLILPRPEQQDGSQG